MTAPAQAPSSSDAAPTLAAQPLPHLTPLFSGSPAAILLVEGDGTVAFASRACWAGADPVGLPLLATAPERARPRLQTALEEALAGRTSTLDVECADEEGRPAWRQVTMGPATIHGRRGVSLVAIDVTARKGTEERLRRSESLLVDAQGVAHMGTWEWELSQPHATWSAELYRIYGLTPETYTPSYEGYLKMVHPDDRQRVADATEAAVRDLVPYSHDERVFRPDGTMRHLHTWAQPVLDADGRLVRLVGVCQDVTDQKVAEGAMRTQTLTRALARRLLVDLISRAHVPQGVVRELGRSLARTGDEGQPGGIPTHVQAFCDLGLGNLRFERRDGGRYLFTATDLLERRADAPLPTCYMALGYLEGVVGAHTGKRALGNEMRCQSMGHKECAFTIMEQGA